MRRRRAAIATLLAALAGAASAQTVLDPSAHLRVELVASGLATPTSMAFVGPDDILVLQKRDGRVRRIVGGVLQAAPVLDVHVNFYSERGLLGIARDPDFVHNGRVYLYYTESGSGADESSSTAVPLGNRVYRYRWDGAALVEPALVLDLPATPGPNHAGGIVAFGPDDALYAVIGDVNRNGRMQNFPSGPAPDETGAVLRLHPSGAPLPDNPLGDPARPGDPLARTFAYGVRNSFGLAFDPLGGSLWDTENGPASYDEINRVVPGFNSGWEQIMGPDARDPQGVGDLWVVEGSTYRDPEFSWASTVAPTALFFVPGPATGCGLRGALLVGDANCGQLYRFGLDASRESLDLASAALQDRVADNAGAPCTGELAETRFGEGWGVVTDIEGGPDGAIYVVSLTLGAVYRLASQPGAFPDQDGDGVDDVCDCAPGDATSFAATTEIPRLRPGRSDGTTLGWDPQAAVAGPGTVYDVVSGSLGALRAEAGFTSACSLALGSDVAALIDSRPDPGPGDGHYYLARAGNGCGAGTFGDASELADPRDALDAALPPECSPPGPADPRLEPRD